VVSKSQEIKSGFLVCLVHNPGVFLESLDCLVLNGPIL
jgi:hypothetical protein